MQQQVVGTICRVDTTNIYAATTTTTTTTLLMEPQLLLFIPTMIPALLPTPIKIMINTKHTYVKNINEHTSPDIEKYPGEYYFLQNHQQYQPNTVALSWLRPRQ